MAVYNRSGSQIAAVYARDGSQLQQAYDVHGTPLLESGPHIEPRDWSGMTDNFRNNIGSAVGIVQNAIRGKAGAYAFPVFTDVHQYLNWNEPNYVAYHWPTLFREFLMLGDMTNTYVEDELNKSVEYMSGAEQQNLLVAIGNHEWGNWTNSSGKPYPREWYKPLVTKNAVFFADDGLTYYWDDYTNNVRFIMLDSCSTVKRQSGVLLFDMGALNWAAGAMEDAGDLDIIVMNHAVGSGFYRVYEDDETVWKSNTTVTNRTTFDGIVNAFQSKGTISITVGSETYTHDFSGCGGDFIAYIAGHYHSPGHSHEPGFHIFACPAIKRDKDAGRGMTFFVIDTKAKTIKFVVTRISEYDHPDVHTYSYEVST